MKDTGAEKQNCCLFARDEPTKHIIILSITLLIMFFSTCVFHLCHILITLYWCLQWYRTPSKLRRLRMSTKAWPRKWLIHIWRSHFLPILLQEPKFQNKCKNENSNDYLRIFWFQERGSMSRMWGGITSQRRQGFRVESRIHWALCPYAWKHKWKISTMEVQDQQIRWLSWNP